MMNSILLFPMKSHNLFQIIRIFKIQNTFFFNKKHIFFNNPYPRQLAKYRTPKQIRVIINLHVDRLHFKFKQLELQLPMIFI